MDFINTAIIKQPMNWFMVASTVLLGAFVAHYLLSLVHGNSWPRDGKSHASLIR